MPTRKKNKEKRISLRRFARSHGIFTVSMLIFYVAFAMFGDFGLLAKDIKAKYAWASTTLMVYVNSLPTQPVLTAVPECVGEQTTVKLTWSESDSGDYYDVMRDGHFLANGISATSYVDTVVSSGANYTYIIIANGDFGSISSLPVTVTAKNCSVNPPIADPQCQITALDGSVIDPSMLQVTENKSPKISGTTNIANAIIMINIYPGPIVSSTAYAQSNGFWEYIVANPLPVGIYTFQITAIDPLDSARRVTKSVRVEIVEDDDGGDGGSGGNDDACGSGRRIIICHKPSTPAQKTMSIQRAAVGGHLGHGDSCGPCSGSSPVDILSNPDDNLPLVLKTDITNKDKIIYSDQDIVVQVLLAWKKALPQKTELIFEILDDSGKVVASIVRSNGASVDSLQQIIPMPRDVEYGAYTVRLRAKVNGVYVTAQDDFQYRESPAVNLGGSIMFSYSELVSGIGWFVIICAMLMLILLIILGHEYFLYKQSRRTITEKGLERDGLISKRKGVSL